MPPTTTNVSEKDKTCTTNALPIREYYGRLLRKKLLKRSACSRRLSPLSASLISPHTAGSYLKLIILILPLWGTLTEKKNYLFFVSGEYPIGAKFGLKGFGSEVAHYDLIPSRKRVTPTRSAIQYLPSLSARLFLMMTWSNISTLPSESASQLYAGAAYP